MLIKKIEDFDADQIIDKYNQHIKNFDTKSIVNYNKRIQVIIQMFYKYKMKKDKKHERHIKEIFTNFIFNPDKNKIYVNAILIFDEPQKLMLDNNTIINDNTNVILSKLIIPKLLLVAKNQTIIMWIKHYWNILYKL